MTGSIRPARMLSLFFFQAEDGIRDVAVTGVQTCALPISPEPRTLPSPVRGHVAVEHVSFRYQPALPLALDDVSLAIAPGEVVALVGPSRSEEHTSELQSRLHLVCRLLLEKKKHTRDRRNS